MISITSSTTIANNQKTARPRKRLQPPGTVCVLYRTIQFSSNACCTNYNNIFIKHERVWYLSCVNIIKFLLDCDKLNKTAVLWKILKQNLTQPLRANEIIRLKN